MIEIFVAQVVAALLGTASIAVADWLYRGGRARQRLHSLWVSCSIVMICLPVIGWTTDVFFGSGIFSLTLVGLLAAIIFGWVYRNLLRPGPVRRLERRQTPFTAQQLQQLEQQDAPAEQR